jgi:hypothetical protein
MFTESTKKPKTTYHISAENRAYWLSRSFVNPAHYAALTSTQILLVPREDYQQQPDPVFPSGTLDILHHLTGGQMSSADFRILCGEESYRELNLRSETIWFPSFLLTNVALPLLLSALYDYLKAAVLRRRRSSTDIDLTFTIEAPDGKAVTCTYRGAVSDFAPSMKALLQEVRSDSRVLDELPSQDLTSTLAAINHLNDNEL